MQLTVLGKSPSWQDAEGACSAYLVREGDFVLLLDCGSGAFAKLRSAIDYLAVDAILITHMHADHILDLIPFASALSYSPRTGDRTPGAPMLYVPPEGRDRLRRLGDAFDSADLLEHVFEVSEYAPDGELILGPLSARFCEVPHFVRAFAVELSQPDGRRFTFGADCGPNEALAVFAEDVDLLMVEATQTEVDVESTFRGHMTAREAGALGQRARARRLVISHFSDELDSDTVRAEASAGFGEQVELAHDGAQFVV